MSAAKANDHDADTIEQDLAVMSTNDDAFETKISAMDAGYFQDRFLAAMKEQYICQTLDDINAVRRRQPVMNRGTYARVLVKDQMITSILSSPPVSTAAVVQFVSLGAGFDTLPFRLIEKWRQDKKTGVARPVLNYVEVDLPPVVAMKQRLCRSFLCQHQQRGDFFTSVQYANRSVTARDAHGSRYSLHACDLRDVNAFRATLFSQDEQHGAQFNAGRHAVTIVISELSLVYMEARDADAVIEGLGRWVEGPRVFVNLEPVQGGDNFGELMDENVAARGSALLGMRTYPSMDSQRMRFVRLGWKAVAVETMLRLWNDAVARTGQAARLRMVEMLDEVEELNLLLGHYCVVVASDGAVDVARLTECKGTVRAALQM